MDEMKLSSQWYDSIIDDAFAAHSRRLLERIKRKMAETSREDEAA